MHKIFLVFLIFLVIPVSGFSSESPACTDLWAYACSDRNTNDGTGYFRSLAGSKSERAEFVAKVDSRLRSIIQDKLNDPNFAQFRDRALSLFNGTPGAQACRDEVKNSRDCTAHISEMLFRLYNGDSKLKISLYSTNYKLFQTLLMSSFFKEVTLEISSYASSALKPEILEKRIREDLFPRVKALVIQVLKSKIKDPAQLKIALERTERLKFGGVKCDKENDYQVKVKIIPNAENRLGTVFYCQENLLATNSEFAIVETLAHEIGHSTDPCTIATEASSGPTLSYPSGEVPQVRISFPIPNLIQCFENPRSTAFDFSALDNDSKELISLWKKSPVVDRNMPACVANQLREIYSDWIAAETLPLYVEKYLTSLTAEQIRIGYANALGDHCGLSGYFNTAEIQNITHLSSSVRVMAILSPQPMIRAQMGCKTPSDRLYCDGRNPNNPLSPEPSPYEDVKKHDSPVSR